MDLRKRFGMHVAAFRRQRRMTQDELAARAEISVDMVAKIEGGGTGTSFSVVERIAGALNVDPGLLFVNPAPDLQRVEPRYSQIFKRIARLSETEQNWLLKMIELVLKKP